LGINEKEWDSVVLNASLGIDWVKLVSHTEQDYDEGSSNIKELTTAYTYDDDGNILTETLSDNSGDLLTKTKTYYASAHFDTDLLIRDRVATSTISHGGQAYRYFRYDYDNVGNLESEEQQEDAGGTKFATISRVFDGQGNVEQETSSDGVVTTFIYDAHGLFPIEESVNLPSGGVLETTRSFNRLTGQVESEYSDAGVGSNIVYDSFGRVIQEYIKEAAGQLEMTKAVDYTYEQQSIAGQSTTVLKTEVWEPQAGHSDTNYGNSASQITYTDLFGHVLQSCQYTEQGNYRKIITRMEDGGYTVNTTEPAFTTSCTFSETYAAPYVQTLKNYHGQTVSVELPAGDANSPVDSIEVAYTYDAQGYLSKTTTSSSGRSIIEEYDTQDRLITKTDPNNISLTYNYNPIGELEDVYQAGNLMTSVTYDLMGRKLTATDANLGTWSYTYNTEGRLDRQTDNMGQYVAMTYDSLGRIEQKSVYNAGGVLEEYNTYTYDVGDGTHDVGDGELFKVEEFDSAGTLLRTTRYGYDSLYRYKNRITRTIDGNDYQQDISQDFRGLTQNVTYPGGESFYYSYDATGKVQTICGQESCSTQYYSVDPASAYNARGQLEEEVFGNGVTSNFSYFANSHRLESMTVAKGGTNYTQRSYTYDSRSNILSIADGAGLTGTGALSNVGYDDVNRLLNYTLTDGATTNAFSYDDQGNMLTNGKVYGADVYQYASSKPHAVTEIGSEAYTYDDNGNMLTDPSRQMTYNALNQLSQVVMTNGTTINFDYDYSGNRVSKVATSVDQYGQTITATVYYLGDVIEVRDGKLIVKLYANNKKILTKALGSIEELFAVASYSRPTNITMAGLSGSGALNLGLFGLMLAFFLLMRPVTWRLPLRTVFLAHRHSMIYRILYDALRVYRITARAFQEAFYAFPQNCVCKAVSLALVFLFIFSFPISQAYAGDEGVPPGEISDETYTYYHHGDHLGSSHLVTEGNPSGGKHNGIFYNSGDLIQRIEYYPFGEEKYVLNPNLDLDPSYTGQQYDQASGLYYYKSRYYNPRIARFIQADTIIPDAENLQSYNRYSYVENNPLKYTDPTGHFSVGFGGSNMMGGGIGLSQEFIGIILSGPGSTPTEGMSGNMASKESADMAAVAKSDQSAVTAIIEKVQTFVKNYKLHEIQALVELKKKRNEIRFKFLTETLGDAGALLYVLSEMYVPDLMPTTVEGVVGTVGLVGVGKLLGTFGRAAKINARTFRYMTEGEIAAIKETGYL
ncbi:hypothetical protein KKF63_13235, partial [bacterium]|nr:hypothetical protein [bacterium]